MALSPPRMVDQDAPHHLGGDAEKVGAALPIDVLIDEPEVALVDERGRLQCVIVPLPTEIACSAGPQVSVNQLEKIVAGLSVSTSPGAQQERSRTSFDGSHVVESTATMRRRQDQVKARARALTIA